MNDAVPLIEWVLLHAFLDATWLVLQGSYKLLAKNA
jgi:hypothetical protein